MIARLENAMEGQRKKLESITKSIGETDDEVSGYGMDDNSSKDNNEEASKDEENITGDSNADVIDDDDSD
jgi:hypothetical protein